MDRLSCVQDRVRGGRRGRKGIQKIGRTPKAYLLKAAFTSVPRDVDPPHAVSVHKTARTASGASNTSGRPSVLGRSYGSPFLRTRPREGRAKGRPYALRRRGSGNPNRFRNSSHVVPSSAIARSSLGRRDSQPIPPGTMAGVGRY